MIKLPSMYRKMGKGRRNREMVEQKLQLTFILINKGIFYKGRRVEGVRLIH